MPDSEIAAITSGNPGEDAIAYNWQSAPSPSRSYKSTDHQTVPSESWHADPARHMPSCDHDD